MLSSLSATEVAFVMAAVMQAVLAIVWVLGAWAVGDTRRAALHWATYAALSAVSFTLLTTALRSAEPQPAEGLRAAGNLVGVIALMALQRGVWLFIGRVPTYRFHLIALALVLVASWIGLDPAAGYIRVGINSGVLALLCAGMARDLVRHARDDLQYRWPVLLAIPVLAGGIGFALRGVRAVVWHASVSAEMTTNSALNIGSALSYLVIALAFHATLMALVVARLVAELRRLSRHDGLTGLLNRRAIEEALAEQVQRSRRNGEAFALMMLDVDHFKAINDHHGHAVGDLALKHVAALLRHGVRDVDHLSRFGGEEFVVLLPAATPAAALALAERLRESVEGSPPTVQQHVLPLTVSIGLAQWAGDADEPRQLLARADAALYRAKAAGRNRVNQSPLPLGEG